MALKKNESAGLLAVDAEAQKYIRDLTHTHVQGMIDVLVSIAKDKEAGTRDRMKAAVRVIDYHARGGSSQDTDAAGNAHTNVLIVTGLSASDPNLDDAADNLRRQLQNATRAEVK